MASDVNRKVQVKSGPSVVNLRLLSPRGYCHTRLRCQKKIKKIERGGFVKKTHPDMVVARRHCIVLTCLGGAWLIRLQEKACRWCHDERVPRHIRQRLEREN